MVIPRKQRTFGNIETQMRRMFERALNNYKEDITSLERLVVAELDSRSESEG